MKMIKVTWGIVIIALVALVALVGQDSGLYYVAGGADYTIRSLDKTSYNANVGDSITVSGKAYIHNTASTTQSYVIEVSSTGGDTHVHKKTVAAGYNYIYTFSGTHQVKSIGSHQVRLLRCVTTDCSYTSHAVGASTLSFSVAGSGGTTTPDPGTPVDISNPTITIKTPADGDVFTTNSIRITGVASDNVGVDEVKIKIGTLGTYSKATGRNTWSADATLAEGRNIIFARAYDSAGNSESDYIVVRYEPVENTPPPVDDEPPVEDPPADDKPVGSDDTVIIVLGGIITVLFLMIVLIAIQKRK